MSPAPFQPHTPRCDSRRGFGCLRTAPPFAYLSDCEYYRPVKQKSARLSTQEGRALSPSQAQSLSVTEKVHTSSDTLQDILLSLLRNIRQDARLTQAQMAEKLGVNQSWVSYYEWGSRKLDMLQVRQICLAVGVPLAEFAAMLNKAIQVSEANG